MPHYDPTKSLRLQIRDRLRDLLEADSLVQSVYTQTIRSLAPESVSETENLVVSLELAPAGMQPAAGTPTEGTHFNNPSFILAVQGFYNENYTTSRETEYDLVANATDTISLALIRYQSDPTGLLPGQARLWDSIEFPAPFATVPELLPKKFWFTLTRFTLTSYQRNS